MAALASIGVALWPAIKHVRTVSRWSETYHLNQTEALQNYRALIGSDYLPALKAVDYFKEHAAFEIAAAALPEIRIRNVTGLLVFDVLSRKQKFSASCFSAAVRQLDIENHDQTGDGEHGAGVENIKASLATAISRWLHILDPRLQYLPGDTVPGYQRFITEAKRKAATETTNSPL